MKRHSHVWLIGATALLLLAAYLRWRAPLAVPPGLGMDELIALQISEQVLEGDLQLFYEAGQGREPIFNYWLAPWLPLVGRRVFTLRVASSALSLVGLVAVAVLVRRLFDPAVALASLAGGATSFWTLFAARAGARSVAMIPFAALSGYLFWRGLASPVESRRHRSLFMSGAGLCLGLTFYAFTAARVLPAVFAFFLLYLWIFHRPRLAGLGRPLLLGAIVALLVMLPLLYHLYTHPQADQFDFREFNRPLAALMSGDLQPALQTSLATLGGFTFQGDPLIFDNVPGRPVFEPLTAFLFLAGVAVALARWRRPAHAFVLIWLPVSLIPGMLSQPAPNFYRIVGAQVVAFVFPGLAIVEGARWLRRRYWIKNQSSTGSSRPVLDAILTAILVLILLVHLAGSWRAYFDTWPTVEGVSFFWQSGLAEAARYLDDAPDRSPVALCTVLTYEHDQWWRPAWQSMTYLLRSTDLDIHYYDCRATLVLPAGQTIRYLFPETSEPFSLIPAELQGEWLAEAAPIPDFAPAGLGAALELDGPPQALEPNSGLVWWSPETGGDPAPLPVRFGDSLALLGYQRVASPGPGEPLRLVTAWEVLATPPPRLVLFSHLLTDPQTLVAQQDSLPLTSHSLRPGDRFLVLHDQIAVPSDSSAEQYLLSIGLYDSDTIARLPLYDGDQQRGDRLFLEAVSVAR